MTASTTQDLELIRESVRALCEKFPESYWKGTDEKNEYPEEFIEALTEEGWLSVLIPEEYGGSGLGMLEAGIILEESKRSGGNSPAGHAPRSEEHTSELQSRGQLVSRRL